MKFLPQDRSPRVAIVGFGYVGSCVAATLAGCGIEVFGIDSDQPSYRGDALRLVQVQ